MNVFAKNSFANYRKTDLEYPKELDNFPIEALKNDIEQILEMLSDQDTSKRPDTASGTGRSAYHQD